MSTYYVLGAVGGPGEKVVNRQTGRGKIINICISDMSGDAKNNKHRRQGMRVGRGARSGWGWPVQRAERKARSDLWRPASEQKEEQVQSPVRLQPLWVFGICKKGGVAGAQHVRWGAGGSGVGWGGEVSKR